MKRIEENINARIKALMGSNTNSHKKWGDRDQVESRYYKDDDLYIIKYSLWGHQVMQYQKSKDFECVHICFCGYDTQTTRQRIRAIGDIFNFSIVNIGTYKYSIVYGDTELPLNYNLTYVLDLINKTIDTQY